MPNSPLGKLLLASLCLFSTSPAFSAIIVDGTDMGESYTLTSTVANVSVSSGILTIGQNGNINNLLTLTGGQANVQNGNVKQVTASGNSQLELNGNNINISSGIQASGSAEIRILSSSNINGGMLFSNTARGIVDSNNLNGQITITDGSQVYMVGAYTTSSELDSNKKVVDTTPPIDNPITGSIGGRGSNVNFSVTNSAALYVGYALAAVPPAAAVPEPSSALLGLTGLAFLLRRKRRV